MRMTSDDLNNLFKRINDSIFLSFNPDVNETALVFEIDNNLVHNLVFILKGDWRASFDNIDLDSQKRVSDVINSFLSLYVNFSDFD